MSHEYNSYHLAPEAIPGFLVEVPRPEPVQSGKIVPFSLDGINYMIYEDTGGIIHLDLDYREVDSQGDMCSDTPVSIGDYRTTPLSSPEAP